MKKAETNSEISFEQFKQQLITDYKYLFISNNLLIPNEFVSFFADLGYNSYNDRTELASIALKRFTNSNDLLFYNDPDFRKIGGFALAGKNLEQHFYEGNYVAIWQLDERLMPVHYLVKYIHQTIEKSMPLAFILFYEASNVVQGDIRMDSDYISKALKNIDNLKVFNVNNADYPGLCKSFEEGIAFCRNESKPAIFCVEILENDLSVIEQFRTFILNAGIYSSSEIDELEKGFQEEITEVKINVLREVMKKGAKLL